MLFIAGVNLFFLKMTRFEDAVRLNIALHRWRRKGGKAVHYLLLFYCFYINFIKNPAKINNIDNQVKTLPCHSKYWPLGLIVTFTVAQISKYEK